MHTASLVLVSLCFTSHARRVRLTSELMQEQVHAKQGEDILLDVKPRVEVRHVLRDGQRQSASPNALSVLAIFFLACNPAAQFRMPSSQFARSRSSAVSDLRLHRREPVMADSSQSLTNSPPQAAVEIEEGGSGHDQQSLDLEQVVEILKADIPQILHKEPNWDIYSDDFHVTTSWEGFGCLRVLSRLLQKRNQIFVYKEDIEVNFVDGRNKTEPFAPFVVARWSLQLERPFNVLEQVIRYLSFWQKGDPVDIEAETMFHFNDKNEVDYVRIDKFVVDGRKTVAWPSMNVTADPPKIRKKIQTWIKDIPKVEPLKKLQELARNVRTLDLSATPVIRRWKQIAAKAESDLEGELCDAKKKIVKRMGGAREMLTQMADDIEIASPDEILALVRNTEASASDLLVNIFAIATAFEQVVYDDTGKLEQIAVNLGLREAGAPLYHDGQVPVVEIGEVVAMPAPGHCGLGEELLLRIVRRAAALGRLVVLAPANDRLEEYYRGIGFEKIDAFGREMVYSKPLPLVTDNELMYEMGSLRVA